MEKKKFNIGVNRKKMNRLTVYFAFDLFLCVGKLDWNGIVNDVE